MQSGAVLDLHGSQTPRHGGGKDFPAAEEKPDHKIPPKTLAKVPMRDEPNGPAALNGDADLGRCPGRLLWQGRSGSRR